MNTGVYTRYELLRAMRNKRVIIFSLAFPVILYLAIVAPNRHVSDFSGTGISLPLYYMVGLAAFATMNAMLAAGGRIAADRAAGWNRQLRVSPLPPWAYLGTKVLTGYVLALLCIVVLYACGVALGVSLPAGRWLAMTGLLLVGLIPFAALGIAIGHLLSSDSIGPAVGGLVGVLALLGGTWFPISSHGFTARPRPGAAVLLARAGEPRGPRPGRLGHPRLGRDGDLDRRPDPRRDPRVPARHPATLPVVVGTASGVAASASTEATTGALGARSIPWPCSPRLSTPRRPPAIRRCSSW